VVETLIAKGNAYVAADGVVYFDVRSFPAYGRLSGNTLESLREAAGGRVSESNQQMKRHPADFMLWKADPKHLMRWPSPWGEGYPGWHLECSVMAARLLAGAAADGAGDPAAALIDLHSGGEDNIFPHHECEIAQSCAGSGHAHFARHWFHARHLMVEGEKMSKSKGNFFTVRDILAKGATPAALRLELVRTHYRVNANFTMQGLKDCQKQIDRWARLAAWLEQNSSAPTDGPGPLRRGLAEFKAALADDLNVARAIGALNEVAAGHAIDAPPPRGSGASTLADELAALRDMDSVLGVLERNEQAAGGADEAFDVRGVDRGASRGAGGERTSPRAIGSETSCWLAGCGDQGRPAGHDVVADRPVSDASRQGDVPAGPRLVEFVPWRHVDPTRAPTVGRRPDRRRCVRGRRAASVLG
jgi:cysteinyl-tRNA synthetase